MRRLVVCALLVALGCGRAEPAATTARPHPPALAPALDRRYFAVPRPAVELYDLAADPLRDLAADPAQAAPVHALEQALSDWMVATSDFLPPPIPPPRGEHGEHVHPGR